MGGSQNMGAMNDLIQNVDGRVKIDHVNRLQQVSDEWKTVSRK